MQLISEDFTKRNLNFFKTFTVAFIMSEMVNIVKDPLHFLYIKKMINLKPHNLLLGANKQA